jgi:GPH family glycoside/pentoside/hexuronide:cation symporter
MRIEGIRVQHQDRMSNGALIGYGLSVSPVMYSYVLILIMYMKYAAVELGVSTAVIGSIFLAAKCWDAVTDPLVGNLSDRTRHASGRRRPWILASAPLIAIFSVMAWVPPSTLEGNALIAWITVAVFGFYTAYTFFEIPHLSLGAELSLDGKERNRIFAFRQALKTIGLFLAGILGSKLVGDGIEATHAMAWTVGGLTIALILLGMSRLPRERVEFQGRGGDNPFRAVRDVFRNRHARLLLFVMFIDAIGTGGIGVLTPFVVHYVVGRPELVSVLLGLNMGATFAAIPLWLLLARRFEKRRLMLIAMVGSAFGYGMISLVGQGDVAIFVAASILAGTCSSCPNVLGYTLKSEIIDCDEHETGERKEGAYFAGWSFVNKLAAGIMIGLVGWALEWSGFDGGVDVQSERANTTMLVLMGGFPLVCYLIGAIAFSRFSLSEAEHARIRAQLDGRATEPASA